MIHVDQIFKIRTLKELAIQFRKYMKYLQTIDYKTIRHHYYYLQNINSSKFLFIL